MQHPVTVDERVIMGISSFGSKRRAQIMNWGRRLSSRWSAVALVNVQQGVALDDWWCRGSSSAAKQLFWRLKSQWKQHMRWERKGIQFSYDPHSYSQNFDDGFLGDVLSPYSPSFPSSSFLA